MFAERAMAVSVVLCVLMQGTSARAAVPRVLVLDAQVKGLALPQVADLLTHAVVTELQKDGSIQVTSLRTARDVAEQQRRLQETGCAGDHCTLELAQALSADETIQAVLSATESGWFLALSRTDVRRGESRGSAQRRVEPRVDAVMDAVPALVREVLGKAPVVTAAAMSPGVPPGTDTRVRVAVMPFTQGGGGAELEPLRRGLMDMVSTDLSSCGAMRVLERADLESVMAEMKLQRTAAFDPATAQKVGRLLGAQVLVLGSYMEVLGTFRVDARVVRVETGEVLVAHGVSGRKEEFVDLQRRLVAGLVPGMGVPLREEERVVLAQKAPGGVGDALDYARAADAASAGDLVKARTLAQAVLARVPGMGAAVRLVSVPAGKR